jgi:Domain of unknown function (DUF2760)
MSDPVIMVLTILSTVVVLIVALVALAVALTGGNPGRFALAWAAFVNTARNPEFAAKVQALITPPPPEPPKPPKPNPEPVRFLGLLQREGRLIDFLTENISAYEDAQVGAAVREIHRKCQAALNEHLDMEPVMGQDEGTSVEVPAGFDPSRVRLTGNVTGQPPFRGTLLHRGWRVKAIKLAPPPEGQDEFVLQPAEVELP